MIGKLVTPGVCAARRRFDSGSSPKKINTNQNSKSMNKFELEMKKEVFIKFSQAEYWLRLQGHETVNPLRLCSSDWTWERCMRVCLTELMKCDAICLLKDWGESRGAITEYYLASRLGMRMMVYDPSRNAGNSAVGWRNGDESTINKHK